ncbi:hypothetical protein NVI2019_PEGOAJLN_00012 [Providencia alcalifaciens]|nr:hypothetical protein [Providencia alcalifaciens]EUD04750.1 hypothetical protein HMPREF1565_0466 [Providencia alcalifaciens RIMD 1656011]CAG9406148.1 hypothetical protein NVI2019_PEGOAJLN_00012 [Providencia alcalifaciens]
MDLAEYMPFLTVVGGVIIIILGFFGLFKAFYIKVPQGTALIVNDMSSQPKVHFTGGISVSRYLQKRVYAHFVAHSGSRPPW